MVEVQQEAGGPLRGAGPAAANMISSGAGGELAQNLLFKLFNDTFISLPARGCASVALRNATRTASAKHSPNEAEELCFVHWDRARLLSGGLATRLAATASATVEGDSNTISLDRAGALISGGGDDDNIDNHLQMIDHQSSSGGGRVTPVSELFQRLAAVAPPSSPPPSAESMANNEQAAGFQLAKLTYLSAGSLLALAGLLTNLLILLIIFVNAKQKCHNITRRGQTSHTNYHYLLLFQLTLTGLLLSGHILIDNLGSYGSRAIDQDSTRLFAGRFPWQREEAARAPVILDQQAPVRMRACFGACENDNELEQANNNCPQRQRPLAVSPLSIFLPPSPFNAAPFSEIIEHHEEAPLKRPIAAVSGVAILLNRKTSDQNKQHHRDRGGPRRRARRTHNASLAQLVHVACTPSVAAAASDQPPPAAASQRSSSSSAQLGPAFFNLLAAVHLWTIVALAYDRYCAIAHPLEYLRAVNETRARIFLVVLWSGALLLALFLPLALNAQLRAEGPKCAPPGDAFRPLGRVQLAGHQASAYFDAPAFDGDARAEPGRQYSCSISAAPRGAPLRPSSPTQLVQLLLSLSIANQTSESADDFDASRKLQYLSIALSLATFAAAILAPLIIITVCNMSIYGIVKVHERRMSASSGSQAGGSGCYLGTFGGAGGSASTLSQPLGRGARRDYASAPDELVNAKSDTCSIASSILGKLIRASAQVGAMGGLLVSAAAGGAQAAGASAATITPSGAKEDASSQCSSANEQEACQLIGGGGGAAGGQSRACYLPANDCFSGIERPLKEPSSGREAAGVKMNAPASSIVNRLTKRRKLISPRHKQPPSRAQSQQGEQQQQQERQQQQRRELILRKKLKRKLSDKEQAGGAPAGHQWQRASSRKSSYAPSEQTIILQEPAAGGAGACLGAENCPCQGGQSRAQSRQQQQLAAAAALADSDGIMRQLKMAGLSFAGIAIGELMSAPPAASHADGGGNGARPLNRSTSCSLGNLAAMNLNGCAGNFCPRPRESFAAFPAGCQSVSRCESSEPAAAAQREKRPSYVSIMSNQRGDAWQERYCTRLLCDSDSESHAAQPPGPGGSRGSSNGQPQQQQQYFNLGGTKSVAFNIVVWLVLLLLSAALPHYSLTTLVQVLQMGASRRAPTSSLSANLTLLSALIGGGGGAEDYESMAAKLDEKLIPSADDHDDEPALAADDLFAPGDKLFANLASWLQAASIWLDCLCRLLFLLMLPLNGWLYGIRSRSLRTTLKMVLKRYISKKQATIEINQRRKSVISTRSRESSVCCNSVAVAAQQQQPAGHQHDPFREGSCCKQQLANGRVFRRCSSFNLPPHTRQEYFDSPSNGGEGAQRSAREGAAEELDGAEAAAAGAAGAQAASDAEAEAALLGARRLHNSSIRFALADESRGQAELNKAASGEQQRRRQQQHDVRCLASASSHVLANCLLPIPALMSGRLSSSQTSSLDSSSLASSKRSLLSASIHSSHSAALLLLDQRLAAPDPLAAPLAARQQPQQQQQQQQQLQQQQRPPPKLTSVLKKRNSSFMRRDDSCDSAGAQPIASQAAQHANAANERQKRRLAHHNQPGCGGHHVVSFARTQSLDRDNAFDSAALKAARGPILDFSQRAPASSSASSASMAPAARARVRRSGASSTTPPPPLLAQISSVEAANDDDDAIESGGQQQQQPDEQQQPAESGSRLSLSRRSSDIKFLLTSAGDQAETKLLLEVEGQGELGEQRALEARLEPQSVDAQTEGNNSMGGQCGAPDVDEREFFEQILVDQSRQQLQQRQQAGSNKLDYYRQIKEAISRYFYSLKRRQLEPCAACARSGLLRQHSDLTGSSQSALALGGGGGPAESPGSHASPNGGGGGGCSCNPRRAARVGPRLLSRRNSLDSHSQALAVARQLEAAGRRRPKLDSVESAGSGSGGASPPLSPPPLAPSAAGRGAQMSRTNSSQSIDSTSSARSEQLHITVHHRQPAGLQRHYQPQAAQSSHLKPPNSLKLIFDPDVQAAALYSSSLALSPIKECSSNHSCASSQSSLSINNNNNSSQLARERQPQSQQPQLQQPQLQQPQQQQQQQRPLERNEEARARNLVQVQ